jgi:hypothetical protein
MSNDNYDPLGEQKNLTRPSAGKEVFSIWWPRTRPGRHLWKFLLGSALAFGAWRYFFSEVHVYFDWADLVKMSISAVVYAFLCYIILIISRYIAYWYSEVLNR